MAPADTTGRIGPRGDGHAGSARPGAAGGAEGADRDADGADRADAAGPGDSGPDGLPELRLVRLDGGPGHAGEAGEAGEAALLRAAALRHRLPPGQRGHVSVPVTTLPLADADPARTPFVIVAGPHPVADARRARARCAGFGVLDRAVHARDLVPDPAHAVLLRAFYVAPDWQGRGVGRAACSAPLLDRLAAEVAPHARELVLCVDEANRRAARVYEAAGFAFTGHRFFAEPDEIQLVMTRPLASARPFSGGPS